MPRRVGLPIAPVSLVWLEVPRERTGHRLHEALETRDGGVDAQTLPKARDGPAPEVSSASRCAPPAQRSCVPVGASRLLTRLVLVTAEARPALVRAGRTGSPGGRGEAGAEAPCVLGA